MNEDESAKLVAQREMLANKKKEMEMMDLRIAELQQRLKKRRSQQQENLYNLQQSNRPTAKLGGRPLSSNVAAVEPYIKQIPPGDQEDDDVFLSKLDPKYQTLPPGIKFPETKPQPDVNSNLPNKPSQEQTDGKDPQNSKPALDILPKETVGARPDYVPSVGHSIAYNAVQETLKNSQEPPKTFMAGNYKPPTTFSNFAPRPYGMTFSTALGKNNSSILTTSASSVSSPIASTLSSPGTGFPKTSTPIQSRNQEPVISGDMKEIFITGAPTVSAPSKSVYSAAGPQSRTYQPLNVVTSQTSGLTPPKTSPSGIYVVSSRPQPPIQPQRTQDPPSPSSSTSSSSVKLTVLPNKNSPQGSIDEHMPAGQGMASKVNSERVPEPWPSHSPSGSTSSTTSTSSLTALKKDDHKPDTSNSAVSSALSVLMGGSSANPKQQYRYAPKSVIANTYMRRLGSGALDQYRKNMNSLYGAPEDDLKVDDQKDGEVKDSDQSPGKHPPPYRGAPPYDLDAERLHYRPNAPKLRRRSSSGESDDMKQYQRSVQQRPSSGFVEEVTAFNEGPSSPADVVRVDSIPDYPPPEVPEPEKPREGSPEPPRFTPTTGSDKVNQVLQKKTNLKSKSSSSSRLSRRVSFDPLALLLDASLEGELDLVKRTAAEVRQ